MCICAFIGRDAEMNSRRIVFKLHIKTDQLSAVEVSGIICETDEVGRVWERVHHGLNGTYLLGTIDVYQGVSKHQLPN